MMVSCTPTNRGLPSPRCEGTKKVSSLSHADGKSIDDGDIDLGKHLLRGSFLLAKEVPCVSSPRQKTKK
jgi:hypothetical protein